MPQDGIADDKPNVLSARGQQHEEVGPFDPADAAAGCDVLQEPLNRLLVGHRPNLLALDKHHRFGLAEPRRKQVVPSRLLASQYSRLGRRRGGCRRERQHHDPCHAETHDPSLRPIDSRVVQSEPSSCGQLRRTRCRSQASHTGRTTSDSPAESRCQAGGHRIAGQARADNR